MALSPDTTNIPAPRVPLIDERTGLMAREWYRFFLNLFVTTGGASNVNLAALQLAPAAPDPASATSAATDALALAPSLPEAMGAEFAQQIQALSLAPPVIPLRPTWYGSFFDMSDQTVPGVNTATAITFDSEDGAFGFRRGSPTSRIIADNPGVYNLQFSLQIDKTAGGDALIYVWPRINGVDVPNTMSRHRVKGNDAEVVLAWNFFITMAAGQYVELMWATDSVDVILDTFAATAFGPATPSAILTVTQVNLCQ